MDKKQIAIEIKDLKKQYRLGQIGSGSLQGDLQSWWARVRHKEEKKKKIGTYDKARLHGQEFMALNGIDLTVYKGEALGIIGHNGAGKSTLLKILSRVTGPTEGTIDIYGRVASMLEVGTGFNGEMTGRENIYMNGAILGMTRAEVDSKMQRIIDFSVFAEFIDTPVKRYSSGMYVKLAFSVAAHLDAEIMVMDEVLAVGDMKFQKKCLSRMSDASTTEGRTVLYVSHNMNTIRQFCTRCIVLDQGRIIFDGDVEDAIAIYMENATRTDVTEFDLSKIRQKYLSPIIKAKMVHLSLLGKQDAVYEMNDPIRFDLTIRGRRNVSDLSLRFEIRSADESSAGTAFCLHFGSVRDVEGKTFRFSFPNRGLVPGKYFVVLGLFEMNDMGTFDDLDVVEKAFGFEIEDTRDQLGIHWLDKFWGPLRLDNLVCENGR